MLKRLLKFLVLILLFLAISISLFIAAVNFGIFGHLYTKEEIKAFENETASLVFSSDDELLGKFFTEDRTNIDFEQIPSYLIDALVATEDARYFEHEGIDSRSLFRVMLKSILLNNKSSGGGSTITQQLAKNMYGRKGYGFLSIPINKTKEAILAYRIENIFNKEEILRLYLNTVPFGENVYGIEAASGRFFNKSVEDLKLEEAAILVGILKANTFYNPRLYPEHALSRRNVVLDQMEKYEYISTAVKDSLQLLPVKVDYANLESEGPANYFLVLVKRRAKEIIEDYNKKNRTDFQLEKDGLIIKTSLDAKLQHDALNAFNKHLSAMQTQIDKQYQKGESKKQIHKMADKQLKNSKLNNDAKKRELFSWDGFYTDSVTAIDSIEHSLRLLQAGLIAMNPQNGNILAWVGGIDFRTQPYDQIIAKRQLASSFKPFLYAAALEEGISPCDYLDNDSIVLEGYDDWSPENYDHTYGGNYSMAGALSRSLNVPTVNLYLKTGYEAVDYLWGKMGFEADLHDSPSTALGTGEGSLYEMAIAYSAFANGGEKITPRIILSIETAEGEVIYNAKTNKKSKIIEDRTAGIINEILQKAINEGTGTSIRSRYKITLPLAGKTGTSQNYSDAWFVAYNPSIVIATRVGASSPGIHFNNGTYGSGSKLALPLVALTLSEAQKDKNLRKKINTAFEPLPYYWAEELDCPDFKEDGLFENLFESFRFQNKMDEKKDDTKTEKTKSSSKKKKKKKSFFKRIFN
jgi:penicillin-binding protein 1A